MNRLKNSKIIVLEIVSGRNHIKYRLKDIGRYVFVFIFLLIQQFSHAQTLEASFTTLAGSKDQLPFWLWAGQLGRYDREDAANQRFGLEGVYVRNFGKSGLGFEAGGSFDAFIYSDNPFRFTELYGKIHWNFLELSAGAFADQEKYMGLSASNGNMASARNARPHPKLRAGFNRFVPLVFPWFSIYGFYEEGLLNDKRYVSDTHLHRKALYVRLGSADNLSFTGGLEHFVMWGGTHPVYGKLPGWESYFSYVFGMAGGNNALQTDQLNVLGNQYGVYQLDIRKKWKDYSLSFYLGHPFEDHSGMELENLPDNLYGLFFENRHENAILQGASLEYYYTQNQSGAFHMALQPDGARKGHGRDNYFNHGVYRSGASYQQTAMVSPFFGPEIRNDSISTGFLSTRFSGVHLGARGDISESFHWKGMISYIKHLGNYTTDGLDSFDPPRKQFSSLVGIEWKEPGSPVSLGGSFAFDSGSVYDAGTQTKRLGISVSIRWAID